MRLRGALPSPRHRLAGAIPHRIVGDTPAQFLWKPFLISMWGNATYGDCTVAEEAFVKACAPGVFVPDDTVIAWARANGAIDGDTLIDVLDKMQMEGFVLGNNIYNDGQPKSVDWTNFETLSNAIAQGPIKLGVAANQLENAVPDPPKSGWVGTNFITDGNLDHCISACGYGSVEWLLSQLGADVPSGIDGTQQGIAIFTWNSIGVLDWKSFLAITGEAWLRAPNTVIGTVPPTRPSANMLHKIWQFIKRIFV